MLAVGALILGVTLVLTCAGPSALSPVTEDVLISQIPLSSRSPVIYPEKLEPLRSQLQPGSNQIPFPPSDTLTKDHIFTPFKPMPLSLAERPQNCPLPPGVYQTYPWTIILVVPGTGIDDRILANPPDTNSFTPIIKPHVEVVPKA